MIENYRYILWDIDNTLIDFNASESIALKKCFATYGLILSEEQIRVYSNINEGYWKLLERGKIHKKRMLNQRFDDFIEYLAVEGINGRDINKAFQLAIGENAVLYEDAYDICQSLQGIKQQYAVTNGTLIAQQKKLRHTGLGALLDGVFISDVVGYQKPDIRFFTYVFDQIPEFKKKEAIIIGDSLSSDMKGANNAGIDCCWINPTGAINQDESIRVTYEIATLAQLCV